MKSVLMAFVCAIVFQSTAFANAKTYTITWKVNHSPVSYFQKAVDTFQKHLDAKTNGRVKVKTVLSEKIAEESKGVVLSNKLLDSVRSGEVQMAQVYTREIAEAINADFNLFDLPYLFRNHEHVTSVVDGQIGNELLASLDHSGVKGLGFTYSGGFVVKASTKKTFSRFEDMKNVTNKTSAGYLSSMALGMLGAKRVDYTVDQSSDSTIISFSNDVDTHSATYSELDYLTSNANEVTMPKVISETNHRLLATTLIINEKFYNSLPKDLQQAVSEAAREAAIEERMNIIRGGLAVRERLKAKQIAIHSVSSEERARWKQRLRPVYTKFFNDAPTAKAIVERIEKSSSLASI